MSKRSYYVLASLLLGVVVALATVPAVGAQGGQQATVMVSQNESSVTVVKAGDYVTVSGRGYKRDAQLALCREGDYCLYLYADAAGSFATDLRYYALGNRAIKVYEITPSFNNSRLKAMTFLNVVD